MTSPFLIWDVDDGINISALETTNKKERRCPCPHKPVELDGEAEVSNAARSVLLDQDVLALQVSVGDGRFPLCAVNLRVQVTESARR